MKRACCLCKKTVAWRDNFCRYCGTKLPEPNIFKVGRRIRKSAYSVIRIKKSGKPTTCDKCEKQNLHWSYCPNCGRKLKTDA